MFYNELKYVKHLVDAEGWTAEQGGQAYHTYNPEKKIVYLPIREDVKKNP